MKYRTLLVLILTALSSIAAIAQVQPNTYSLKGIVADSLSGKPLDLVTVRLKGASAQAVKTAVTKADGQFVFDKIPAGKYSLGFVNIGYTAKTIAIEITNNGRTETDLGTLTMSAQNTQLSTVSIVADKPLVKQEVDRLTYDLQSDPESKVNSVLDMMRKVPLLSVDAEDNVLLKGATGYKILINGKPSSMMERNPKDILRSMPASTIEKIEVITSPPSRYDAEGLAGIINIITTKKIDNGYNGTVNLSERFPVGGPGIGTMFTYKQGKIGFSASGGASLYFSPNAQNSSSMSTGGSNATILAQNSIRKSESRNGYFGTEFSFEADSLNLFSAQVNINGSRSERSGTAFSSLSGSSGVIEGYDISNSDNGKGRGADAALNYQRGFRKNKSRLLTMSYRYYGFNNQMKNLLHISDTINYSEPDYRQANEGSSSEQTLQLDYVQPGKKLNIEAGVKGILRHNKSDFQLRLLNSGTGEFEVDPSRTNKFDYSQNVFAAYNAYQYNLKDWSFKAGTRLEQTVIDADFISSASHLERVYWNLIPSFSVLRKFKNINSINLAYSQRIQRPGIGELNPFVDRSNPNFETSGNPALRPSTRTDLKIGYTRAKKASLNITANYTFGNLVGPVSVYNPVTKITRTRPENTGKVKLIGNNMNLTYPVNKKLNISLNTDLRYLNAEIFVANELTTISGFMAYGSVAAGYRFDNGWRINGNFSMNSPGISGPQAKTNAYANSSFSVNRDIVKDKLSFSASTGNPFNKFRIQRDRKTGLDFEQLTESQTYYRSFNLSMNYRFGKLKEAMKKSARGIRNDDVSNGGF